MQRISRWILSPCGLNRDGHDQYRYITLGFGNKIARLAVMTDASSVDGEWNFRSTLPELTQFGGGALHQLKYFNKAGLDALRRNAYARRSLRD